MAKFKTALCSVGLGMTVSMLAGLPPAVAADGPAPKLSHTTVLTGRENPWDMAFLPDGTMFFTEKCKGLSVRMPGGDVKALLGMTGVKDYAVAGEDLFCKGQAGMMGVAVDPDFAKNRQVYVYSTSSKTAPGSNRLMRMTVSDDFTKVANRTDIVEDVPYKALASDHPFGGPGAVASARTPAEAVNGPT